MFFSIFPSLASQYKCTYRKKNSSTKLLYKGMHASQSPFYKTDSTSDKIDRCKMDFLYGHETFYSPKKKFQILLNLSRLNKAIQKLP